MKTIENAKLRKMHSRSIIPKLEMELNSLLESLQFSEQDATIVFYLLQNIPDNTEVIHRILPSIVK